MVYAGHPETFVISLLCLTVLAVSALASSAHNPGDPRALLRPILALCAAGLAALGLAAPLLLPGAEVINRSTRGTATAFAIPPNALADLFLAGYHGFNLRGSRYFGAIDYYETAAYVGLIVLALAFVALLLRHDSVVLGLVGVAAVCAALSYWVGLAHLFESLTAALTVSAGVGARSVITLCT